MCSGLSNIDQVLGGMGSEALGNLVFIGDRLDLLKISGSATVRNSNHFVDELIEIGGFSRTIKE